MGALNLPLGASQIGTFPGLVSQLNQARQFIGTQGTANFQQTPQLTAGNGGQNGFSFANTGTGGFPSFGPTATPTYQQLLEAQQQLALQQQQILALQQQLQTQQVGASAAGGAGFQTYNPQLGLAQSLGASFQPSTFNPWNGGVDPNALKMLGAAGNLDERGGTLFSPGTGGALFVPIGALPTPVQASPFPGGIGQIAAIGQPSPFGMMQGGGGFPGAGGMGMGMPGAGFGGFGGFPGGGLV